MVTLNHTSDTIEKTNIYYALWQFSSSFPLSPDAYRHRRRREIRLKLARSIEDANLIPTGKIKPHAMSCGLISRNSQC